MNETTLRIAAYLLIAVCAAATGWQTRGWKEDSDLAHLQALKDAQAENVRQAVAAIADTTAKAVAGIRITNTTIYQKTRHEITKEPMDPGCRLPVGWMRNINAARAGADRPGPAAAVP